MSAITISCRRAFLCQRPSSSLRVLLRCSTGAPGRARRPGE
jgi:hypothetical protein